MDITVLLDRRNNDLFLEISRKCNVSLRYSSDSNYACYSEGQNSIIYIPKKKPNIASFTHELLHIYLRTKEMYAGGCLARMINESADLVHLFDKELVDHITNVVDHIKMLPIFTSLGFEKEQFIDDFSTTKCTEKEIKTIERYHSALHIFKPQFFKLFVGKFFSMKGCPNDEYNYDRYYKTMDTLDFILLQDLNNFYNEWQSYDINKNNIAEEHYRDIMNELVISFQVWNMTN